MSSDEKLVSYTLDILTCSSTMYEFLFLLFLNDTCTEHQLRSGMSTANGGHDIREKLKDIFRV